MPPFLVRENHSVPCTLVMLLVPMWYTQVPTNKCNRYERIGGNLISVDLDLYRNSWYLTILLFHFDHYLLCATIHRTTGTAGLLPVLVPVFVLRGAELLDSVSRFCNSTNVRQPRFFVDDWRSLNKNLPCTVSLVCPDEAFRPRSVS